MATFVANTVREAGATLPEGRDAFDDDDGHTHEANINALAAAGIVRGVTADRYAPDATLNRAQMATFLIVAYEYIANDGLSRGRDAFGDDNGNTHEPNIDKAANAGFATGTGGGDYAPDQPVKRDQMASFLTRMFTTAKAARR